MGTCILTKYLNLSPIQSEISSLSSRLTSAINTANAAASTAQNALNTANANKQPVQIWSKSGFSSSSSPAYLQNIPKSGWKYVIIHTVLSNGVSMDETYTIQYSADLYTKKYVWCSPSSGGAVIASFVNNSEWWLEWGENVYYYKTLSAAFYN